MKKYCANTPSDIINFKLANAPNAAKNYQLANLDLLEGPLRLCWLYTVCMHRAAAMSNEKLHSWDKQWTWITADLAQIIGQSNKHANPNFKHTNPTYKHTNPTFKHAKSSRMR